MRNILITSLFFIAASSSIPLFAVTAETQELWRQEADRDAGRLSDQKADDLKREEQKIDNKVYDQKRNDDAYYQRKLDDKRYQRMQDDKRYNR